MKLKMMYPENANAQFALYHGARGRDFLCNPSARSLNYWVAVDVESTELDVRKVCKRCLYRLIAKHGFIEWGPEDHEFKGRLFDE